MVTVCCSESHMRSRTSRGVPEWSGGKDLNMGSPILVTEKVSGAIGNVPIDRGNCMWCLIESLTSWFNRWNHRGTCGSQHGYPDPVVGYWPESCLGHVCMIPEHVWSTHLRFDDARVIGNRYTWLLKVVRSLGWDPRRHEEFRNDPEVKI